MMSTWERVVSSSNEDVNGQDIDAAVERKRHRIKLMK